MTGHIRTNIFYGDLVNRLQKFIGKPYFTDQIKMIVNCDKGWILLGYNATVWICDYGPNHGL